MATKTISVNMEAYRRLRAARRQNESFSGVINRMIHTPIDMDSYLHAIRSAKLSSETLEAVHTHIEARHSPSGRRR